ncbi:hypothetical protein ACLM5H_15675 [Fredinandcohnia humi]
MTIKVIGDFEKVKSEMKKANKSISDEIKAIKKPYRRNTPHHVQHRIDYLASKGRIYSVSKVLPVRIDGIVINFKLYEAFMKKLKDFETNVLSTPEGIVVQYWKRRSLAQGKGLFKLYDLNKYFKGFEHIPNAEIVEDGSEA